MSSLDRFTGCLLGLALGDALGAPFEGGVLERLAWQVVGRTRAGEMRWTDDTQMALDLADSLLAHGGLDPDDAARRFAASYRWSRGYGAGAAKVLKRIGRGRSWHDANRSVFRDGSHGNGGAMRAPVVGMFCAGAREELLVDVARESARITHAHPLGIQGAVLIATATAASLSTHEPIAILDAAARSCAQQPFAERLAQSRHWLTEGAAPQPHEVRACLGNGVAATESCVTALYLAARFIGQPFEELTTFVRRCGGDTDTIGAMASALWGAVHGASRLPEVALRRLEARDRLEAVARALHAGASGRPAHGELTNDPRGGCHGGPHGGPPNASPA